MRTHGKTTAALLAAAGLAAGLVTGGAAVAWLMSPPRPAPAARRRGPSRVPATTRSRRSAPLAAAAPAAWEHPIIQPPVDQGTRIEQLSPPPRTRTVRFVATLVVLAVLATVAGLAGSARATSGQQKKLAVAMTGGDPDRGKELIDEYGCSSCHTIPGVRGATALVGPPLTQIGGRSYIAGVLPNTPRNLIRWLQDPPAVNPGTAMPNLRLTGPDARDIATYLYTLR